MVAVDVPPPPAPQHDDPEDVAWALSTAEALWRRGEYADSVSWLRRAATAASEVGADLRVLELAKAASDLSTIVSELARDEGAVGRMDPMAPVAPLDHGNGRVASAGAPDDADQGTGRDAAVPARESGAIDSTRIEIDIDLRGLDRPSSRPPPSQLARPIHTPLPSPLRPAPLEIVESASLDASVLEHELAPRPSPESSTGRDLERTASDSAPRIPTMPPPSAAGVETPPSIEAIEAIEAIAVIEAIEAVESASEAMVPCVPPIGELTPSLASSVLDVHTLPPASGVAPRRGSTAPPLVEDAAVEGAEVEEIEHLADIPDDARGSMLSLGEVVTLLPNEERPAPPLVVVLQGDLEVRAMGCYARIGRIGEKRMGLLAPMEPARAVLVVTGGPKGVRLIALPDAALEHLRAAAPWVVDELAPQCDELQAIAGALDGALAARIDGALLMPVLAQARAERLAGGDIVLREGELVRTLIVVGAGSLSLRAGADPTATELGTIDPGEIVFPSELLARAGAPSTVRVGDEGALVVVVTRAATEELLVTLPPLLEILAEG